jgi:hypothetical protein
MAAKNLIKKIFRIALWIIGAWLIIGSIVFIGYPSYKAYNLFVDREYKSKVDSIEFRPGHRGSPHLKLNSGWYLLTIDEMKIIRYLQAGDSIVKEKGSTAIRVFRKNENGQLKMKEFD